MSEYWETCQLNLKLVAEQYYIPFHLLLLGLIIAFRYFKDTLRDEFTNNLE